jgi:hypothetical protein
MLKFQAGRVEQAEPCAFSNTKKHYLLDANQHFYRPTSGTVVSILKPLPREWCLRTREGGQKPRAARRAGRLPCRQRRRAREGVLGSELSRFLASRQQHALLGLPRGEPHATQAAHRLTAPVMMPCIRVMTKIWTRRVDGSTVQPAGLSSTRFRVLNPDGVCERRPVALPSSD